MRCGARRVFAAALAAAVLGCAGAGLKVEKIPITENPVDHINALSTRVDKAGADAIDVLSPTWFARAESSLDAATDLRQRGAAPEPILRQISEGNAQLDRALAFASVARTALPEPIDARKHARAAGAPSLAEDYSDAEERFLELTRAIESDDLAWAQRNADDVAEAFRAVELKAIKENTLRDVRTQLAVAKKENAKELAPRTLRQAQQKLAEAEQFIEGNRYASEEMNALANAALFAANRAVAVTRRAQQIRSTAPEKAVLEEEDFLASLATSLSLTDLRDQSFATQRQGVENGLAELVKDRNYLVDQTEKLRAEAEEYRGNIARLEGQNAAERERAARLEEDKRFQALYDEVSGYFEPAEAEVYKQENKLVVRLRGIQFPVGQHVLLPEEYALLSKVQKAIRSFGSPLVTIEGHTDTTGSADLNAHLSELRAQAVRDYLVANNTLSAERITAVGKGFSQPLADNRTAQGRALNRRIDVIIDGSRAAVVPTERDAAVGAGPDR